MGKYLILLYLVFLILPAIFVIAETNPTVPYVDPKILEEFNKTSEVKIIVEVRDTSGITITSEDSEEEQAVKDAKRTEYSEDKTNFVLSTLPETEFRLSGKFLLGNGFYGHITKKGIDILLNNSNVLGIYLDRALSIGIVRNVLVDNTTGEKESKFKPTENNTISKNITIKKEQKPNTIEIQKQDGSKLLLFWIIILVIILIIGVYLTIKFKKR